MTSSGQLVAREPLLLYSAQTILAYLIAQKYYGGRHYMWCAPSLHDDTAVFVTRAPSSTPLDICRTLQADVSGSDQHSTKIAANIAGILKGASEKRAQGAISGQQESEIIKIVSSASRNNFRPILCVVPYERACRYSKLVPVESRANPLFDEYIVDDLPRELFDVILVFTL